MLVKDIVSRRDLVSVLETATVLDAAELMTKARVGAVIVNHADGKLAGIFTERDLMSRVVVPGKAAGRVEIGEVMTRDVFSVGPETKVAHVRAEMQRRHIRHLPITVDGKVIGMVSLRDILRADLDEAAHRVEALESYLLGGSEPKE